MQHTGLSLASQGKSPRHHSGLVKTITGGKHPNGWGKTSIGINTAVNRGHIIKILLRHWVTDEWRSRAWSDPLQHQTASLHFNPVTYLVLRPSNQKLP